MCNNNNYSCIVNFLLAIIFGFLIGLLVFLGLLTNLENSLIIAILSAFIISIALFTVIVIPRYVNCVTRYGCGNLIGIIGTIIFSTAALSITLGTNILSAVLVGGTAFFLTYLIIQFVRLLNCVINRNENWMEIDNNNNLLNTNLTIDSDFTKDTSDITDNFPANNKNSNQSNSRTIKYCNNFNK